MSDIKKWFLSETDNLATLIGYVIATAAGLFAVWQWRKDQNWKKKEALLGRAIAFKDTPGSYNALLMLDSANRNIPLWDCDVPNDRWHVVYRKEVALALIPPTLLPYQHSESNLETAIRDCFSDLFARLTHIEVFLADGMIEFKDIELLMNPMIPNIKKLYNSPEKVDQQLFRCLKLFADWKGLRGLQDFFVRFKIELKEGLQQAKDITQREIENDEWQRAVV